MYLSHRYIYYSPLDAKTTVIRTNLDGTGMVKADFTSMCDAEWGWCGVWTDNKDVAYIDVNITSDQESYYSAKRIYTYDFSTGTSEEVPKDNAKQWMRRDSVTDGEYVYYIYEDVFDLSRLNAHYELHRCGTDGTGDILLYDDLAEGRWYYPTYSTLTLYKNDLYVPIRSSPHDNYVILKFDKEGEMSVIDFPVLSKKACRLIGIYNDRHFPFFIKF